MLARVSSKRVRSVAPIRAKAAPAAAPARGPSASGAEASKHLEDLLASYVSQNAPQTKKLTYSLKPADQQKTQSFNYPTDLPEPTLRQTVGSFRYQGTNEQFAGVRFGLKFLKLANKFEVQAAYLNLAAGDSKPLNANINPSTMTPAQIYDYYQTSLKSTEEALTISTRINKSFDSAEQAIKFAFGDINGVEFFVDEDLTQKVSSSDVTKAVAEGHASFKFVPKGNWSLPQELQAELKN